MSQAPKPRADLLPRTWWGRDIVAGLTLAIGAFFAVGIAAAVAVDENEINELVLGANIGFQVFVVLVIVALARHRGLGAVELGLVWPRRWGPLATAWLGAHAIVASYFGIIFVLSRLGAPTDWLDDGNAIEVDGGTRLAVWALLGTTLVVGAPIAEELLFRGLVFRGLRGYWRLLLAMGVSGFLFGAFHLNLSVVVPFTLVGALFAWCYEESGSLWATMGAHAGFNGVSFVATLFQVQ